nr:OB-fold nucleic acid binding domain-containing protein [Nitrospirota bacterium]
MKKQELLKNQSLKSMAGVSLLIADEGQDVVVEGEIIWVRDGKALLARVRTDTATIEIRIFHPAAFHRRVFRPGASVRLRGKLTRLSTGRPCLVHPRIILR